MAHQLHQRAGRSRSAEQSQPVLEVRNAILADLTAYALHQRLGASLRGRGGANRNAKKTA